jgi:hypothetical protein
LKVLPQPELNEQISSYAGKGKQCKEANEGYKYGDGPFGKENGNSVYWLRLQELPGIRTMLYVDNPGYHQYEKEGKEKSCESPEIVFDKPLPAIIMLLAI